jgi:hypothetical protein
VRDRDAKGRKATKGKKDILRLDSTGKKWFQKYFKKGSTEHRAAWRLAS